jgi:molecular chaperone DnaK
VDKALKDLGDKVGGEDRVKVESALGDLKTAMAGDEKEAIDRKAEALSSAAGPVLQQASPGGAGGPDASHAHGNGKEPGQEDVLDAEFEEVKGKDHKA